MNTSCNITDRKVGQKQMKKLSNDCGLWDYIKAIGLVMGWKAYWLFRKCDKDPDAMQRFIDVNHKFASKKTLPPKAREMNKSFALNAEKSLLRRGLDEATQKAVEDISLN